MFKNALVSCSNKEGLGPFIKALQAKGMRVVSTGGTAKYLREHGVQVVDVSEQTKFPEVMDGRVKTLHPHVHMALLCRDNNSDDQKVLKQYQIEPFDLVVGNLYPFEEEPGTDNIDIGGPSFLRAAAKSFERVTVLCEPKDYDFVLSRTELTMSDRQKFAAKVFAHTSAYDSMISAFFAEDHKFEFPEHTLGGKFVQSLRYGENPQQKAVWYKRMGDEAGLHMARVIQGKELSYNNLLDLDAAAATLREFQGAACVAVKHNNPCGVAIGGEELVVVQNTINADPQSIFGGIIATNFTVSGAVAEKLNTLFLECVVAPKFSSEALEVFAKKKNLRLLEWPQILQVTPIEQYRTIQGGFLVQTADRVEREWDQRWAIVGPQPSVEQKRDLLFANQVCAHLKSNAIAVVSGGQTVGLGMGQVNRVDAVHQAIERLRKFHGHANDVVLASDAFFPFPDSIEKISAAGIKAIIQPGGSIKDDEVKAAAQKAGLTMVLTGQRHFLH